MNNFYSITSKYFSRESIDLIKINTLSYKFKRKCSTKESYITLKKQDLLNSMELIKDYDIISLSAVSDLLSKNYIKNLLKKLVKVSNIIYFSICFQIYYAMEEQKVGMINILSLCLINTRSKKKH